MGTSITKYAYSVSGAHLLEKYFFSGSEMERLLSLPSYDAVVSQLNEKGWIIPEDSRDVNKLLNNELSRAWKWITDSVPEIKLFELLILRNDYHNLKAGIKSLLNDFDVDMHFISPCLIEHSLMKEAIEDKNYDLLPEPFNELGKEVYDILVRTEDGQLADLIIDRKCSEELLKAAQEAKIPLLTQAVETSVANANIKTAYRAIKTGKKEDFLKKALAEGLTTLDNDKLISCIDTDTDDESKDKTEKLLEYLSSTPYAEGTKLLSSAPADYEKWIDDKIMSLFVPFRYSPLGPEPILGFWFGKEAEVKNIRIILAAKQTNLPPEIVAQRLRRLYE